MPLHEQDLPGSGGLVVHTGTFMYLNIESKIYMYRVCVNDGRWFRCSPLIREQNGKHIIIVFINFVLIMRIKPILMIMEQV